MKTLATRIMDGSRVDRALALMERIGDLDQFKFRDLLLDMSRDKTQADALRNDLLKRGLVTKTIRYEISDIAKNILERNAK